MIEEPGFEWEANITHAELSHILYRLPAEERTEQLTRASETGASSMEATFFTCPRADALGVSVIDDLPCEPACEPVRIASTGILSALARTLCGQQAGTLEPLRDATCRSFPVFEFASSVVRTLAALPEDRVDEIAERWLADASWQGADIDLYETTCLLSDIRQALRESESPHAALFVLLEEKAI